MTGLRAASCTSLRELRQTDPSTTDSQELGKCKLQRANSLPSSVSPDPKKTDSIMCSEVVSREDCGVVGVAVVDPGDVGNGVDGTDVLSRVGLPGLKHKYLSSNDGTSTELSCSASATVQNKDSTGIQTVDTGQSDADVPASRESTEVSKCVASNKEQGAKDGQVACDTVGRSPHREETGKVPLKSNCTNASCSLEAIESSPSPDCPDSPVILPPLPPFPPLVPTGHKPNGLVMNDEIREELGAAAAVTSQAYMNIRAGNTGMCAAFFLCVYVCICSIVLVALNVVFCCCFFYSSFVFDTVVHFSIFYMFRYCRPSIRWTNSREAWSDTVYVRWFWHMS